MNIAVTGPARELTMMEFFYVKDGIEDGTWKTDGDHLTIAEVPRKYLAKYEGSSDKDLLKQKFNRGK